jgi:hypothetical protein
VLRLISCQRFFGYTLGPYLFYFPPYYAPPFPGRYKLRASHPDYDIEMRGSEVSISYILIVICDNNCIVLQHYMFLMQVDLRFGNAVADDIFFVSGYNIYGSVVAQV